MNIFYLALISIPAFVLLVIMKYLGGLTCRKADVQGAFGDWRFPAIGEDIIAMLDEVDAGNRRDIYFDHDATDRQILREYLPDVFAETRELVGNSGSLTLYLLFACFSILWGLVWLKSWAFPSLRDLRALVGFEVLICRQAQP